MKQSFSMYQILPNLSVLQRDRPYLFYPGLPFLGFEDNFFLRKKGISDNFFIAFCDHFEEHYALINRECGPYAKIFAVTSRRTDRTK